MSLSKKHPKEIIDRCIAMELIRENGADLAAKLNPNFVKTFNEIQLDEDENEIEVEVNELDFEYMLFDCPMHQFAIYFGELNKMEEAKKLMEDLKNDITSQALIETMKAQSENTPKLIIPGK